VAQAVVVAVVVVPQPTADLLQKSQFNLYFSNAWVTTCHPRVCAIDMVTAQLST
jgi:hypothetical protein